MELWNVKDVAKALRVSTRQIWKLVRAGKLVKPVRLSRSVRWRSDEIGRFITCDCDMQRFEAGETVSL